MSLVRLKITYTIEEYSTFDIEEFQYSEKEIALIVNEKIDSILPGDQIDYDWEFETEPKVKGSLSEPPSDWHFESILGRCATDGYCLIFANSPVKVKYSDNWLCPTEEDTTDISLDPNFRDLPEHKGNFSSKFLPFTELDNLRVFGRDENSLAYLVYQDNLIACLCPKLYEVSQLSESKVGDFCFVNYDENV